MKTKNMILVGIVLMTLYMPVSLITTIYVMTIGILDKAEFNFVYMLPWLTLFCVYLLGILVIDIGLRKLIKSEN